MGISTREMCTLVLRFSVLCKGWSSHWRDYLPVEGFKLSKMGVETFGMPVHDVTFSVAFVIVLCHNSCIDNAELQGNQ